MKNLLLTLLISTFQLHDIIACDPPTKQPTEISLLPQSDKIKISFKAAEGGEFPPEVYLVIRHVEEVIQGPENGKLYTPGNGYGKFHVVSFGPETEVTAEKLEEETEYFFTIYSAKQDGSCYNTTEPLHGKTKTTKGIDTETGTNKPTNKLTTLLNFNFAGEQNGWTNFTPIVFYGWTTTGKNKFFTWKNKKQDKKTDIRLWQNAFQIGPYAGSVTSLKDSTSHLPSLMLPGNGGLQINYFMTFFNPDKFNIKFAPLNFGVKVISGYTDTTLSVVQHNLRTSVAIEFAKIFNASVQYSRGWHNLTDKSYENFSTIFKSPEHHLTYWNINLSCRLSPDVFGSGEGTSPLFFSISWHSLAKKSFAGDFPNSKFITIGFINNLDITSGTHPGHAPQSPSF